MTTLGCRAHRRRRALLALLIAAGIVVTSCTDAEDAGGDGGSAGADGETSQDSALRAGVTDDEIAFAVVGTGTANPTGTCSLDCYLDGVEAYFAYRNSEGGVHGRQLTVTRVVDDELSNTQVRVGELLDAQDTFAILGMPFLAAGFADIADAGVPLYTTILTAQETAGQESSFPNGGVPCISCPQQYPVYAAEEAGATRVASLGYSVSQVSRDCVSGHRASFERYGAERGTELVYSNDELPFALPNGLAPEVAAMKEAGVELVLTCIDQNAVKTLAQELEAQGLSDVTILLPGEGYGSPSFLEGTGDLFDGDLMLSTFRPFESDIAGTGAEKFLQWLAETGRQDTDVTNAMFGWLNADLAYRGIEAAGPEFDRDSVVEATNAIEDYTADGVLSPVDWSRQHEPPTPDDPLAHGADPVCAAFMEVNDGAYEVLGDRSKPWVCWDPAVPGYTEPERRNFP
jgi:ABC-type branched-subunit amino acid transport system substrate-binding protein